MHQWKLLLLKLNYILVIKVLLTNHCIFPSSSFDKGAFYGNIKLHINIIIYNLVIAKLQIVTKLCHLHAGYLLSLNR